MSTIRVVLPDGAIKELPQGSSALSLALAISKGLAESVVVARVNGVLADIQDPLPDGAKVELLKASTPEGLDTLRHSCEHLLAAALVSLFKGAQVTMGPKIHSGEFYYDFDIGRPFTPEDLKAIEDEMAKLIAQKVIFKKSSLDKAEAEKLFDKLGQRYKREILAWIPEGQVSIYQSADFIDLCRGPHLPHAGFIKAFKLLSVSGSYWRGDSNREMLQRITGIAFASKPELETYLTRIEEAKRRDHRRIGTEQDLFMVSERFDSHDYPQDQDAELLIAGTARSNWLASGCAVSALADDIILKSIPEILAPKTIQLGAISIQPHEDSNELEFDLQIKLMSSSLSKEQKAKLAELEKSLSEKYPTGKLRVVVESKFVEEVGAGLVTWLPKGARIRTIIEDLSRKMHFQGGYDMVFSPHIAKSDLWKVSGHWFFYKDSMFPPMTMDGHQYVVKPMNCPFHVMIFKNKPRSYRDLPQRYAELGTVYRYELAGVMHGLMRVRGFTQDDAHLFCRWDQIDEEIDNVIGFILKVLRIFGFKKFDVKLSTRPEKFVGAISEWEKAEAALLEAVKRHDLPYEVDAGGGAFYGPKIDIKLQDSLERSWQCSTVQLDFNNPERFGLSFTNDQGQPEQPVMIHRALLGSMERFMGVLIEEYAGAFPVWLAPEQIRILTVADRHLDFAKELMTELRSNDMRVTVPTISEKLGAKIRQAQLDKVPIMLVVGDQEADKKGASVRLRTGEDLGFMDTKQLADYCRQAAIIPI